MSSSRLLARSPLASLLCALLCAPLSGLEAAPPTHVAYFDHYAHGVGRSGEEAPPLCVDGVDNDSDGVKDPKQACDPKRRAELLKCAKCHAAQGAPRPFRHAQCEGCHNTTRILARAGSPRVPYCRSCHINATTFRVPPFRPLAGVGRFIEPAPEGGWSQLRLTRFDHELHSRWAGVCEACHVPVSGAPTSERERRRMEREGSSGARSGRGALFRSEFSRGGHEACARCHTPSLGSEQPTLSVEMDDCGACHDVTPPSAPPTPSAAQTTGFFRHADHAARVGSNPCRVCHTSTGYLPDQRVVQLPAKSSCSACHGSAAGVAFDLGPSNCAQCHLPKVYQP